MALQSKIGDTTFSVGDKLVVYQKIQEGEKTRTQPFEGTVIAIKGGGENQTFIVRKMAGGGIGVERIFPFHTPSISKIEVVKQFKVRQASLGYLRKGYKKRLEEVKKAKKV